MLLSSSSTAVHNSAITILTRQAHAVALSNGRLHMLQQPNKGCCRTDLSTSMVHQMLPCSRGAAAMPTAHLTPKERSLRLSTWISPLAGTSIAVTYALPGRLNSESVPRLFRLWCRARTTSAAPMGPAAAEHREVSRSWLPFSMAILGMSLAAMRSPTP